MLYDEEQAIRNIKLKNSLIERFKGIKTSEVKEYDEKKKQDKPVIDAFQAAINELGDRLAIASIKKPEKMIKKESIKSKSNITLALNDTVVLAEDIAIALNNSNDFVFGLRPNGNKRCIGDTEVDFNNEEIIIKEKSYKVTKGLLILLTRSDVKRHDYNETDLEKYKEILIRTNAIYQNNNPNSRRPKASQSLKYLNIIKPIYELLKTKGAGNIYIPTHKQNISEQSQTVIENRYFKKEWGL